MKNHFKSAVEKKELLKFALGMDNYFLPDREYGEHSVIDSWINNILPLIETDGYQYLNPHIINMFIELLNDHSHNKSTLNECLLYHLHVYYYLQSENRIKAADLREINPLLINCLNTYIDALNKAKNPKGKIIAETIETIKSRGGLLIN